MEVYQTFVKYLLNLTPKSKFISTYFYPPYKLSINSVNYHIFTHLPSIFFLNAGQHILHLPSFIMMHPKSVIIYSSYILEQTPSFSLYPSLHFKHPFSSFSSTFFISGIQYREDSFIFSIITVQIIQFS